MATPNLNDPTSVITDLSELLSTREDIGQILLSTREELRNILENPAISSYDKMYAYYLNCDKAVFKNMNIHDTKKLIKFLCAVSYQVIHCTYAQLLNNVLADLNKFNNTTADHIHDVTGFTEFLNLTAMILVEQAIYNIDNNEHQYRIIQDVEDVANVSAAMQMKYDTFIDAISIF